MAHGCRNLLSQSLPDLGWGKSLGEDHHNGQRQEGYQRDAPATADQDLGPDDRRSFVYYSGE
jgi:hypothetical protein